MDATAHAVQAHEGQPGDRVTESPHSRTQLVAPGEPAPAGFDALVVLHDGKRLAYAPSVEGPDAGAEIVPDPLLRGNAFAPVLESARTLAAMLSVAAGRRVDTGPESERVLVVVRGHGIVFLQNEDILKFDPGTVMVLPPGEPARVWSQGPEDVLAVVLQPAGQRVERRTLAGEIARRRGQDAATEA